MSTWDEWFEDVWDALVTKVKTVTEFGEKVYYGKKASVDQFPAAYVCPHDASSEPYTMQLEDLWKPVFVIYVVLEDPDTKAGVIAVWKLAGKIIEAIKTDRSLGGLLHTSQVVSVLDSPEGLGEGMEQHWVSLTILCQRKI